MRRLMTALTTVCVLALAFGGSPAEPANTTCRTEVFAYKHAVVSFTERGDTTRVHVEIADTGPAQEYGLMCRASLGPNEGMLFSFPEASTDQFWMKQTLIPLSIAFIDAHWHIVNVLDMPTAADPLNGPWPLYSPKGPYNYALEVNLGFFAQHGIDTSADVTFLPLASLTR